MNKLETKIKQGNIAYKSKNFNEALKLYKEAIVDSDVFIRNIINFNIKITKNKLYNLQIQQQKNNCAKKIEIDYHNINIEVLGNSFKRDRSKLLKSLGAALIGPILAKFYYELDNSIKENKVEKLYFLSREGYFLEKIFVALKNKRIIKNVETKYLLTSRTLLFKLALTKADLWMKTLMHPYEGKFSTLLQDRYGFDIKEVKMLLDKNNIITDGFLKLPEMRDDVLWKFNIMQQDFVKIINEKLSYYKEYLQTINFGENKFEHIVDIGYSGTIQNLITELTGINSNGHYVICSSNISVSKNCRYFGHVLSDIKPGDGNPLLERSSYIEAILTAPHGTVIDVYAERGKINFIYGSKTNAQKRFSEIEVMIEGATDYIINAINNKSIMDKEELIKYYGVFISNKSNFPWQINELFEMDDCFSGIKLLNPINYFD